MQTEQLQWVLPFLRTFNSCLKFTLFWDWIEMNNEWSRRKCMMCMWWQDRSTSTQKSIDIILKLSVFNLVFMAILLTGIFLGLTELAGNIFSHKSLHDFCSEVKLIVYSCALSVPVHEAHIKKNHLAKLNWISRTKNIKYNFIKLSFDDFFLVSIEIHRPYITINKSIALQCEMKLTGSVWIELNRLQLLSSINVLSSLHQIQITITARQLQLLLLLVKKGLLGLLR